MDKNNTKERRRLAELMAMLQEIFTPGKEVSPLKIRIYYNFLKDLPIEQIEKAVEFIVNTKKYPVFPLPSEIREVATNTSDEHLGMSAIEAWNFACRYVDMGTVGDSSDEDTNEAIRVAFGGWDKFRMTNKGDESYDRNHFISIYKMIHRKKAVDQIDSGKIVRELLDTRDRIKQLKEGEGE